MRTHKDTEYTERAKTLEARAHRGSGRASLAWPLPQLELARSLPSYELNLRAMVASSKPFLDYRDEDLRKGGRPVTSFRVTGKLTELALKVSRQVGATALEPRHVPDHVELRLDNRGVCKVKCHLCDREMATRIAKAVRRALHGIGLEVRDVVRRAATGGLGDEHDLVLEVVDPADDDLVVLRVSGELKCRQLTSQAGRNKVRELLQTEAVDECVWWQKEAATETWGGRLVILVNFPEGAGHVTRPLNIYTDYTPVGGIPRGISGWPYARRNYRPGKVATDDSHATAKSARPGQSARPSIPRAQVRVAAPPRKFVIKKDPFPKPKYRKMVAAGNILMAPGVPVLLAAKKSRYRIKEKKKTGYGNALVAGWSSMPKGRDEWVANMQMLDYLYNSGPP